ncbi:MAG: tetraacyldisaccharide 4'-kinase [Tannerellaceae bacterium]|jgi:tetraacyldisaccharide 4'-kinase|nr:tetraacyldisaccharide 4'-kinase [Tannerellaceae bacterium]
MPTGGDHIKLNYILAPLSLLYGLGVRLRNVLFTWKILPVEEYPIPVISIGNLSVGGTGKTPHTEYLIRLLKDSYRVAVLSRGYKRTTSGYVLANALSNSRTIGDEPYQMKRKFPDILIAVDSNRRRGISQLLELPEEKRPQVILLDDAFQHRYVIPSLSIVLTDYKRLFYKDMLLPAGRLREPKRGICRADIVIVTKCEDQLKPIDLRIIEDEIRIQAHQLLYFTHIAYGTIEPAYPAIAAPDIRSGINEGDGIVLLAGIAAPEPFVEEVERYSANVTVLQFPDHHTFDRDDFRAVTEAFKRLKAPDRLILTTEKDAARLQGNPSVPEELKEHIYYMPITIRFNAGSGTSFDDFIKTHIMTFQQKFIYNT